MGLVDDFLLLPDWIKLLLFFGLLYSLGSIPLVSVLLIPFLPFLPQGSPLAITGGDVLGAFIHFVFGLIGINANYELIVVLFALMLLITFIGWMESHNQ